MIHFYWIHSTTVQPVTATNYGIQVVCLYTIVTKTRITLTLHNQTDEVGGHSCFELCGIQAVHIGCTSYSDDSRHYTFLRCMKHTSDTHWGQFTQLAVISDIIQPTKLSETSGVCHPPTFLTVLNCTVPCLIPLQQGHIHEPYTGLRNNNRCLLYKRISPHSFLQLEGVPTRG